MPENAPARNIRCYSAVSESLVKRFQWLGPDRSRALPRAGGAVMSRESAGAAGPPPAAPPRPANSLQFGEKFPDLSEFRSRLEPGTSHRRLVVRTPMGPGQQMPPVARQEAGGDGCRSTYDRRREKPQLIDEAAEMPDDTVADPRRVIAELQRELALSRAERDEALARQAATSEILRAIAATPSDAE